MISEALLDEIEKAQYTVPGYVYLIKCSRSTYYKIGNARNVESRRDMLQVGCPYYLVIIATLSTNNPQRLEKAMHKKFKAKRMYGEWFDLTQEEVAEFCKEPNCKVLNVS